MAAAPAITPNFFIVGSFKAGTTSFYEYLRTHPDIYMSAVKEPHYFVHHSALRPQVVAGAAAYKALFATAGAARVVGEASAWYFSRPESPGLIHAFNPQARILILLRHPVEVAYAFYWEQRYLGRERRRFEDALPEYAALILDWPGRIAAWRGQFGAARVKLVVLEDFIHDPRGVYAGVLSFLGVDAAHAPPFAVHNPAKALPPAWLARLSASPPAVAGMRIISRYPGPAVAVEEWRKRRMRRAPRPPLTPELRRRLMAEFAPVVTAVEALLERPLPEWRS